MNAEFVCLILKGVQKIERQNVYSLEVSLTDFARNSSIKQSVIRVDTTSAVSDVRIHSLTPINLNATI